jgi:hypothetical protein
MPKRERPTWGGPVHFSELKQIAISPAHFRAAIEQPAEQTPAMAFGVAVHAVVFGEEYAVFDGRRWGRDWDIFKAKHADSIIMTREEYAKACAIAASLQRHPIARDLLWGDVVIGHEQALSGPLSLHDIECAGTADVLRVDGVCDLKTTTNAQPSHFLRGAIRMAYHAQLAMYDAMRRAKGQLTDGTRMPRCHIVAVEKAPPYGVNCYELSSSTMLEGARLYTSWLAKVAACRAADAWPCYPAVMVPFDMGPTNETDDWHEIDGERVDVFDFSVELVS